MPIGKWAIKLLGFVSAQNGLSNSPFGHKRLQCCCNVATTCYKCHVTDNGVSRFILSRCHLLDNLPMPPPSTSSALHLKVLVNPFRIFKLEPSTPFPLALLGVVQKPSTEEFMSITRNSGEVSVVTDHVFYESDELGICEEGEKWRCIKVQGPMEHSEFLTCPCRVFSPD